MTNSEYRPPSIEEIKDMVNCTRQAEFILWDTDEPVHAQRTESGAPCGTELLPRKGIRGWEICGKCLKNPALKAALLIGAK